MYKTGIVTAIFVITNLAGCGNPGGISDDDYAKFQQLGAPKLLYSCTTTSDSNALEKSMECVSFKAEGECSKSALEKAKTKVRVGYVAGIGAMITYNELLQDAQAKCTATFDVIEAAN